MSGVCNFLLEGEHFPVPLALALTAPEVTMSTSELLGMHFREVAEPVEEIVESSFKVIGPHVDDKRRIREMDQPN